MATLRKRGQRWHVQVRRKGRPSVTRSFLVRADAEAWGRQQEIAADRGDASPSAQGSKTLKTMTVAEVVRRYRNEVMPNHRGSDKVMALVDAFLRQPIAKTTLESLSVSHANTYVAARLKTVKSGTVRRELDILRRAFAAASKEWDIPVRNVFAEAARPKAADPRDRRFKNGEREMLRDAMTKCRNPWIPILVELAVETGMRRGEILSAKWEDVSWDERTLHIPHTKNGHARTIPLSSAALALLKQLHDRKLNDRIVPISASSAKEAWKRLCRRSGLKDFRFHDLRHEAISSFFERGLNVPEVALISGHRDPRMLFRYTHPKPELVALKLG